MEMNDTECMLMEFANEENSVAVGFRSWFLNKYSDQQLQGIIQAEEEVIVKWPKCDIGPSSVMKTRLKKHNTWDRCVGRVLAFGDYVKMNEFRQNYIEDGVLETSKNDIKNRKRINPSNDHCQSSKQAAPESTSKKVDNKKKKDVEKRENYNVLVDLENRSAIDKLNIIQDIYTSEDEDNISNKTKKKTVTELKEEISILKLENKTLRDERVRLEILLRVKEDLPEIQQGLVNIKRHIFLPNFDTIPSKKQCTEANDNTKDKFSKALIGASQTITTESNEIQTISDTRQTNKVSGFTCTSNEKYSKSKIVEDKLRDVDPVKITDDVIAEKQISLSCRTKGRIVQPEKNVKPETHNDDIELATDAAQEISAENLHQASETRAKLTEKEPAGVYMIPDKIIAMCSKDKLSLFVNDLMSHVYTPTELMKSSLQGKICNVSLGKKKKELAKLKQEQGEDDTGKELELVLPQREKLDPIRLEAIREAVKKVFLDFSEKKFLAVVKTKLNNESRKGSSSLKKVTQ